MAKRQPESYPGTILPDYKPGEYIRRAGRDIIAAKEKKKAEMEDFLSPDIKTKWDRDAFNIINPMIKRTVSQGRDWLTQQGGKLTPEQIFQTKSSFRQYEKLSDMSNTQYETFSKFNEALNLNPEKYDVDASRKNLDIYADPETYGDEEVQKQLKEVGDNAIVWRARHRDEYGLVEKLEPIDVMPISEINKKIKPFIAPPVGSEKVEELKTGQIKETSWKGNTRENRISDLKKYYSDFKQHIDHWYDQQSESTKQKYNKFGEDAAKEWYANEYESSFKISDQKASLTQKRLAWGDGIDLDVAVAVEEDSTKTIRDVKGNYLSMWLPVSYTIRRDGKPVNLLISANEIYDVDGLSLQQEEQDLNLEVNRIGPTMVFKQRYVDKDTGNVFEAGQPIPKDIGTLNAIRQFPNMFEKKVFMEGKVTTKLKDNEGKEYYVNNKTVLIPYEYGEASLRASTASMPGGGFIIDKDKVFDEVDDIIKGYFKEKEIPEGKVIKKKKLY